MEKLKKIELEINSLASEVEDLRTQVKNIRFTKSKFWARAMLIVFALVCSFWVVCLSWLSKV